MNTYSIRPCQEEDLPKLIQLCKAHAEYERAEYTTSGKEANLKKALFANPPALYCLVVDAGSTITGYASYTFDFSTWEAAHFLYMDCLYLEPKSRNKGIGEELMNKLIQIAKENKCANIQWQTPVFNEGAIRFYNRIGGISKSKVRFTLPS